MHAREEPRSRRSRLRAGALTVTLAWAGALAAVAPEHLALALGSDAPLPTSAEDRLPPAPNRWVTDTAGLLSDTVRAGLDRELARFERATGHQLVVWIGDSTGRVPLEEWAARTFEAWGVGRKQLDDGLALFVLAKDRHARIEVGYGLEPLVTDALAGRILDEALVPRLRAGDADGAVLATVRRLEQVVATGDASAAGPDGRGAQDPRALAPGQPVPARPMRPIDLVLFAVIGVGMLILFIRNPALALFILSSFFRRGGGGGGDGGFGGGGGRSGGGGASRDW